MPKHGFLTPKAIANRIKSKGLQKLRWYCEMCQKQCRDENGFKCHIMSESHQRQLLLVAENQEKFVDKFSDQFLNNFLTLLRRRHNTQRVMANRVYNEYIADKEHVHMNATKWQTLTEFVKYLGREGHCIVDETPKGWFIQWIDRDPEEEARRRKIERQEAKQRDEEERQAELIRMQMEKDRKLAEEKGQVLEPEFTSLRRQDGETVKLSMQKKKELPTAKPAPSLRVTADSAIPSAALEAFKKKKPTTQRRSEDAESAKRPVSMLEQLKNEIEQKRAKKEREEAERQRAEEEEAKARQQREEEERAKQAAANTAGSDDSPWLAKDIVVKIIHKKLADGKYHKRKGYVKSLVDTYTANVRLLDSKTTLKLDQAFLETVIPNVGGHVLVLRGEHRDCLGKLKGIDMEKFRAEVKLLEGKAKGTRVKLPYEDFSKLYEPKA